MPNHVSAEKRVRQSIRRRERNKKVVSATRTAVKKVYLAATEDAPLLKSVLKKAIEALDGAAAKGVIPKKRASRKVSRLSLRVNKLLAGTVS